MRIATCIAFVRTTAGLEYTSNVLNWIFVNTCWLEKPDYFNYDYGYIMNLMNMMPSIKVRRVA